MAIVNEMRTKKDAVFQVMRDHIDARNSYKQLWYWYLRDIEGLPISQESWNRMMQILPETLTRLARFIVKEHPELKPTDPEVLKTRGFEGESDMAMRELMRSGRQWTR